MNVLKSSWVSVFLTSVLCATGSPSQAQSGSDPKFKRTVPVFANLNQPNPASLIGAGDVVRNALAVVAQGPKRLRGYHIFVKDLNYYIESNAWTRIGFTVIARHRTDGRSFQRRIERRVGPSRPGVPAWRNEAVWAAAYNGFLEVENAAPSNPTEAVPEWANLPMSPIQYNQFENIRTGWGAITATVTQGGYGAAYPLQDHGILWYTGKLRCPSWRGKKAAIAPIFTDENGVYVWAGEKRNIWCDSFSTRYWDTYTDEVPAELSPYVKRLTFVCTDRGAGFWAGLNTFLDNAQQTIHRIVQIVQEVQSATNSVSSTGATQL